MELSSGDDIGEVADFIVSLPGKSYSEEGDRLLDYELFELASNAEFCFTSKQSSDHLDVYKFKFRDLDSNETVVTNSVNDSYGMIEENARKGLESSEYLGEVQNAEFNLSHILRKVDEVDVAITGLNADREDQRPYLPEDDLKWNGRLIRGDNHLLELEASVLTDRGTEYVDVEARIDESWMDALSAFDAYPYLGRL